MKDYTGKIRRTLERLESQLATGKKPEKINGKTTNKKVNLTEKDKLRINSEIKILKYTLTGSTKSFRSRNTDIQPNP